MLFSEFGLEKWSAKEMESNKAPSTSNHLIATEVISGVEYHVHAENKHRTRALSTKVRKGVKNESKHSLTAPLPRAIPLSLVARSSLLGLLALGRCALQPLAYPARTQCRVHLLARQHIYT